MITMIGGVIAMVSLLVTRLPNARDVPALPANLAMPAGATAQAVTFGAGWIAVVSQDNRILIFGVDGKLRQQVQIVAP